MRVKVGKRWCTLPENKGDFNELKHCKDKLDILRNENEHLKRMLNEDKEANEKVCTNSISGNYWEGFIDAINMIAKELGLSNSQWVDGTITS